jgi:hypothetical protein
LRSITYYPLSSPSKLTLPKRFLHSSCISMMTTTWSLEYDQLPKRRLAQTMHNIRLNIDMHTHVISIFEFPRYVPKVTHPKVCNRSSIL